MKKYNGIDLCKFIMAIIVVSIHTRPLENCGVEWLNRIYAGLTDMAVPFFFLSAGFLLGIKMEWPYTDPSSLERIKRYLLRIMKLYAVWNIIYFPLALVPYITGNESIMKCILLYLRGLLITGEHYNSWMLWYLLSTIYGLLFLYLLLRKKVSNKLIVILCCCIFLISSVFDLLTVSIDAMPAFFRAVAKLIRYTFVNVRILRGAYYLPIGLLLAHKEVSKRHTLCDSLYCNKKAGAALMIIGFTFNLLTTISLLNNLAIVCCSVGIFTVFKRMDLPDFSYFPTMRKIGTSIYFIHMYVWTIYYSFQYGHKTYGLDCFICTAILSIIISYVYIMFTRKNTSDNNS